MSKSDNGPHSNVSSRPTSPVPGGNNTDHVEDSAADKIAPKDPSETHLREPSTPPGHGIGEQLDDRGDLPTPL